MEVHAYGHSKHFEILPHVLSKNCKIEKRSECIFFLISNTIYNFQNLEKIL